MHMVRNAWDLDIDLWGSLHDAEGGASLPVFNNGDGVLVDGIEGHEFDLLIVLLQRVLQQRGSSDQLFLGWHLLIAMPAGRGHVLPCLGSSCA